MVGVPGRSKACVTCRKRRKGCDFARPACNRCKQAGLVCGGYDTPRVFVVSTPESRQPGYSLSAATESHSPWIGKMTWERLQDSHEVATYTTNFSLLARPEDERRCLDLFWEAYFPSGKPLPEVVHIVRSYNCSWTETARSHYQKDNSLRYALWANCLFFTGRRLGNNGSWMIEEATKLYGKALTGLRKSLCLSNGARRDALIATIKLVSMFEASSRQVDQRPETEPSQNWQRGHYAGELALFIARSPHAHIDGNAHHMFADERIEMALVAILQRKRLVLSTPEWKTIPFQKVPKNLKDMLVDVLVDMPDVVHAFDQMQLCRRDPNRQAELRDKLVQKCWDLDQQLQNWLHTVCQAVPKMDLVTKIGQTHGLVLYWTTSLVLYTILHRASLVPLGSGSDATDLCSSSKQQHLDPIFHAEKLAEAIPLLLQPSAGLYGWQGAELPLEVAIQHISNTPLPLTLHHDESSLDKIKALVETFRSLKQSLAKGPLVG
ncbi:Sterigmatocystin biosynthesis regulatory protein [Podospora australis]|uniref:Sterigmatocystin biosynthesis regulatory protein n=1 Tax=Podospora australis TaxID=1536484 RepID=A0AAN6WIS5_9PEZI|nr:Sterigmatocystin biosynthesis regulatory protein [Podospora australis]